MAKKCEVKNDMKVTPNLEKRTIGFTVGDYIGPEAKTGVIPCREGFEVVARLKVPYPGYDDWSGTTVALTAVPFDKCDDNLYEKEDPNAHIYGVRNSDNLPCNLKVSRKGSKLHYTDPITVTYSKKDRTVKFSSKNFDYYQTDLPDKDFGIYVWLCFKPQELELKLIYAK